MKAKYEKESNNTIDRKWGDFESDLTNLLNIYGWDTKCHTPDFILAEYIGQCLMNYCVTINNNIAWHGTGETDESKI